MESVRQQKVSRLLQKEVGQLFQKELAHLVAGNLVTVSVVRMAPDLGFAKVYVSVFPADKPKNIIERLNNHIGEIHHQLYAKIRNQFRKMPELRFYHDDSLDYAERIYELLPD